MSRWAPWTPLCYSSLCRVAGLQRSLTGQSRPSSPSTTSPSASAAGSPWANGERSNLAGIGGLEFSYLHGVFGAHLARRLPRAHRAQTSTAHGAELLVRRDAWRWSRRSPLLGERPEDVEETVVTFHVLIGIPIPLWRDGSGRRGNLLPHPLCAPRTAYPRGRRG